MEIKMVPVRDFVIVYNSESDRLDPKKSGRWILFSRDPSFSAKLVRRAVRKDIVHEAKYVRTGAGPISFYLNADDDEGHVRLISWLLGQDLLPRNAEGTIRDQKFIPDAGAWIHRSMMLSDYIDLASGSMRGLD